MLWHSLTSAVRLLAGSSQKKTLHALGRAFDGETERQNERGGFGSSEQIFLCAWKQLLGFARPVNH
jgi:hypothetical protein